MKRKKVKAETNVSHQLHPSKMEFASFRAKYYKRYRKSLSNEDPAFENSCAKAFFRSLLPQAVGLNWQGMLDRQLAELKQLYTNKRKKKYEND